MTLPRLILASASPRRLDLLNQIGFTPDAVVPADIDETPQVRERPRAHALRLAREKAVAVQKTSREPSVILAADTVVALGHRILPKAEHKETALDCLIKLSGRRHTVYGGLAIIAPDGRCLARTVATVVTFKRLQSHEIDRYLATMDWDGKAGGYAIQGRGAAFVKRINGSYSNVVGLCLYETANLLRSLGIVQGGTTA